MRSYLNFKYLWLECLPVIPCLAYFRGWSNAGINEEETQVKDHRIIDYFEIAM